MKVCRECKAVVNRSLEHCPLCGSHLEEERLANPFYERYEREIEPNVSYPKLTRRSDDYYNFLRKKSLILILAVVAVCVLINLLLTRDSLWSGYVVCAGATAYLCVITSLVRRRRFYSLIAVCSLFIPLAFVGFDMIHSFDATGSLAAFGVSFSYLVPAFLLGSLILCDVLIFWERSAYKYYRLSLILVSLLAVVPQLLDWIFSFPYPNWFTLAVFFFSLLNAAVICIVCWKQIKQEIRNKFFV